ncbi:MAG: hypothetical protein JJU11_11970 [Candidatus Sumerlaeia bacterium]|nr:hypothetical protein [Candidatus Sumerlaeia bacterium]
MKLPFPTLGAALILASGMSLSAAPTVYLSPTGDDSNPGTEADPFLTFDKALDEVEVGGTILVQPGTYTVVGVGGSASGPPGIAITKSVTIRGTDPADRPVVEFENLAGTGSNTQNAIRISASDVTLEHLELSLPPTSDDSVMISIPSGSAPTYDIIHENITIANSVIDGAIRGVFSHAGNLTIENNRFQSQPRPNVQIRTFAGNLVIRNNEIIGIPSFNDRQAVIFEGFGDLPGLEGVILIEGNTIVNKNQAVLLNQWNPGGELEFYFRNNTLENLANRSIIFFIGSSQNPDEFQRFRHIDISDNIFNSVTRLVSVDYFGSPDVNLSPVPAPGQIRMRNNTGTGLGSLSGNEISAPDMRNSYRTPAPPTISMDIYSDLGALDVVPDYANPGGVPGGDVSLQPGSPLVGASTTGATVGGWQTTPAADTIVVVADAADIPASPTDVYTTSLGEALLSVNPGGTVVLEGGSHVAPSIFITRSVDIVPAQPGPGSVDIITSDPDVSLVAISTAGGVLLDSLGLRNAGVDTAIELRGLNGLSATIQNTTLGAAATAISAVGTIDLEATRNIFLGSAVADVLINDEVASLDVGSNLFMGNNHLHLVPGDYPSTSHLSWGGNWYAANYDEDLNNSGYIDGLEKVVTTPSSPAAITDDNVVAQLDRSANGLADAIVLAEFGDPAQLSVTSFSGGIPGGPDIQLQLTSTEYSDVRMDDTNGNGVVDWYERSLGVFSTENPHPATLGRVNRGSNTTLADAIRALQLINGSVPFDHGIVDLNAINVTGQGPRSLANPLQILRFQAGVRLFFPAIAGID